MTFKPFVSPHVHPQSLDSGSTPEAFAERELELGTGYLTVTDHGSLGAARKVYDLAKAKGLTPILGIEAYFFDADCPILKSFGIQDAKKYNKYYHLTIHALDQAAYETIVRLLSKAPTERHGSELKPLFNWRDLEEIGAQNVTFTSGCLIGMVQRHVLNHNRVDIAEAYYRRLSEIVKPGHFFVEVFPHRCDKNWVNGVFVTYADNSVDKFYDNKGLNTEKGGEIKAIDLAKAFGRKGHETDRLLAVQNYSKWDERNKVIVGVKKISDFMPNECRPWAPDGDVQLGCNRVVQYFAGKYGHKILISDDSHYAHPDERIVQDIRLASMGDNFKFYGNYHRQSSEEAFAYFAQYMKTDRATFEGWIDNSHAWAEQFKGFKFNDRVSLPKSFYPANTLGHLKAMIDKHGRMDWTNQRYVERLKAEIAMIQANGKIDLLPYFFLAEEAIAQFAAQEQLTGPGRGSAAGMLLTYLLGITHADPLRYNLSMDRFLTKTRILSGKLPDIDMDLPNRDILTDPDKGWLKQRFGECYAQISVDTSMKVKSSIRDVARATYGKIPDEIERLSKKMAMPPQGISDRDYVFGYSGTDGWVKGAIDTDEFLKEYIAKYPKQWDIVVKCLGVVRNKGRHASAYVVTDEPVSNFIPLQLVSDVLVTQYTAGPVEKSGGVKMDFLGLNTLLDISEALKLIRSRASEKLEGTYKLDGRAVPYYRVVPLNGKLCDVWDLPDDQSVYDMICRSETDTVFQFNTDGAKKWLKEFNFVKSDGSGHKALNSIESLAAFTALDRPGPLDAMILDDLEQPVHNMLVEYAKRAKGEQGYGRMALLDALFPETHGIIVYQEQLEYAFREIGGTTADQAEAFRRDAAKKEMAKVLKHRDLFMPGAISKLGEDDAKKLWASMETFAQYGFNKSHAVCYSLIGYACAFLKYHYPLEWWTAVLRNASKDEVNEKFWRHCGHLINLPDISKSGDQFEIVGDRIQAPLSLLHGIGEGAHKEMCELRPFASLEDFCQKVQARRETKAVMVEKKKKDKKTGAETVVMAKKMGHSALNRGVVYKLIVSGAMDSLFPGMTDTNDMLEQYERVLAQVSGKKPVKVKAEFINLSPLVRYQMRKAILPAYSQPLLPILNHPQIVLEENGLWVYRYGNKKARFAPPRFIDHLNTLTPFVGPYTVATASYVVSSRRFRYGGDKEAMELVLDVDSARYSSVLWPDRKGKLPSELADDLTGAVIVAVWNKSQEAKPFQVVEVEVIQSPLGAVQFEESPDAVEG